jgi:hypothetical protein
MEQSIREFFEAYARRFNDSLRAGGRVDVQGVVDSFAPHFVESGPVGVQGASNGLLFRWMVPRGFARYRRIGTKRMLVRSLEVTELDLMHAMARVGWHSEYTKKSGEAVAIDFEVIYLMRVADGHPKIFAYIAGDEQKALREHGVI